jgi:hypothetical protein
VGGVIGAGLIMGVSFMSLSCNGFVTFEEISEAIMFAVEITFNGMKVAGVIFLSENFSPLKSNKFWSKSISNVLTLIVGVSMAIDINIVEEKYLYDVLFFLFSAIPDVAEVSIDLYINGVEYKNKTIIDSHSIK